MVSFEMDEGEFGDNLVGGFSIGNGDFLNWGC